MPQLLCVQLRRGDHSTEVGGQERKPSSATHKPHDGQITPFSITILCFTWWLIPLPQYALCKLSTLQFFWKILNFFLNLSILEGLPQGALHCAGGHSRAQGWVVFLIFDPRGLPSASTQLCVSLECKSTWAGPHVVNSSRALCGCQSFILWNGVPGARKNAQALTFLFSQAWALAGNGHCVELCSGSQACHGRSHLWVCSPVPGT